jgi:hypothetical protein
MKALRGTGVARVVLAVELDPPPPPPPPVAPVEPGAAVAPEPERVVPLAAVLTLDEVPVEALAVVITVDRLEEVAEFESAELALGTDVPMVTRV